MMKKKNIFFLILLLGILVLTACKGNETEEKNELYFSEDILFTVNGEGVSIGEWNLYARPIIDETGSLYGKEIWSFKMDSEGKLFGEALQEDIRNRIADVKLVSSKASEFGITLSEDDKTEVSIAAGDYLEKLTDKEKKDYKIDEETVEKVYTDNFLATKVYEYLTLNVDTDVDETEVRHMILQYVTIPKTYEDKEGNTLFYEEEVIQKKRAELDSIRERISNNQELSLKNFESDSFSVNEITTDLDGLKKRLPENMAEKVFWLRKAEVSDVLETEESLFLFDCIETNDEESTKAARIRIIEQREQQVYESAYTKWKENVKVENNPSLWKSITDEMNSYGTR